ncbi:MAG: dTDP-4-dehydrorhamnose reductase [Hydrococcus sp. Prado102]|jgi:dTDP-4-dehydrorhamnose reductase|nr:dTDP-4-dehydrorhamnose reductase [Hydrococcus sp. Prado102]
MTKRILITGVQGQLGQELQQTLTSLGEVIGVGRESMDLSHPSSIRQVISQVQPHFIVNAAAYTAVDKAESEVELAYAINAIAPEILAQEAQRLGATLLHASTDYVFDGQKNTPYLEEDSTNPLSIYGKSKLAGEENIKQACQSYIILRTAWVYGTYGKSNFVKTMLRLGKEREEIRVVSDQVGSPTWARDIAGAITDLLVNIDKPDEPIAETYHFTNSGVASWYDFAIAIFEEAKHLGIPLKVKQVIPITTAEYPTPAIRPAYSVLSGKKISTVLGTYPAYWRDSLRQMLKQLYSQ